MMGKQLKVGDTIVVRINDRYNDELVRVDSIEEDIKNGLPGWDGVYVDRNGKELEGYEAGSAWRVWGYMDQILAVR